MSDKRLTEHNGTGTWSIKGVEWDSLKVGQTITKEIWEKLYGALGKLKDYEDTGLSPEDVEREEAVPTVPVKLEKSQHIEEKTEEIAAEEHKTVAETKKEYEKPTVAVIPEDYEKLKREVEARLILVKTTLNQKKPALIGKGEIETMKKDLKKAEEALDMWIALKEDSECTM